MDEFVKNLGSAGWWLGVVVVSFVVNLVSAYAKPPIDGFAARTSGRWRLRTASQRERFEAEARGIAEDPQGPLLALAYENKYRLQSLPFWMFAFFFAFFAFVLESDRPVAPSFTGLWQAIHAMSLLLAVVCAIAAMTSLYKATSLAERISRAKAIAAGRPTGGAPSD